MCYNNLVRIILRFGPMVLLLILAGVFLLDGLQVRSTIPVDERTFFEVGIAKALVKNLLVGTSVVWFGLAGRRAAAQW